MFLFGLVFLFFSIITLLYFLLKRNTIIFIHDFLSWAKPKPNQLLSYTIQNAHDSEYGDYIFSTMPGRPRAPRCFESSTSEAKIKFVKRRPRPTPQPKGLFITEEDYKPSIEVAIHSHAKRDLPQSINPNYGQSSGFSYQPGSIETTKTASQASIPEVKPQISSPTHQSTKSQSSNSNSASSSHSSPSSSKNSTAQSTASSQSSSQNSSQNSSQSSSQNSSQNSSQSSSQNSSLNSSRSSSQNSSREQSPQLPAKRSNYGDRQRRNGGNYRQNYSKD